MNKGETIISIFGILLIVLLSVSLGNKYGREYVYDNHAIGINAYTTKKFPIAIGNFTGKPIIMELGQIRMTKDVYDFILKD